MRQCSHSGTKWDGNPSKAERCSPKNQEVTLLLMVWYAAFPSQFSSSPSGKARSASVTAMEFLFSILWAVSLIYGHVAEVLPPQKEIQRFVLAARKSPGFCWQFEWMFWLENLPTQLKQSSFIWAEILFSLNTTVLTLAKSLLFWHFSWCFYDTYFNILPIFHSGTVLKNLPINATSTEWMLLFITELLKAFLVFFQTTALVCWCWNQFEHRHNGLTFPCLFV